MVNSIEISQPDTPAYESGPARRARFVSGGKTYAATRPLPRASRWTTDTMRSISSQVL